MDLLNGFQRLTHELIVRRGAQSRYVTLGGRRLHFYDVPGTGNGAPVLLVHGLGASAQSYSRVLHPLSRRFDRVLALDFPGSGFSPLPASGPLPVLTYVDVLRDFVQEIVRKPAFVVGNSLGGALSIELAESHPEWVRAIALIAPAGAQLSERRLEELLQCFDVQTPAQARALTRKLFHKAPLAALLFASEMRKVWSAPAVRSICAEARSLPALQPDKVARLKMPVLFLWGESERLLPNEGLDFFRTHLPPHSHSEVVRGFGHIPQVERPAEVVERLTRFAELHGICTPNPRTRRAS